MGYTVCGSLTNREITTSNSGILSSIFSRCIMCTSCLAYLFWHQRVAQRGKRQQCDTQDSTTYPALLCFALLFICACTYPSALAWLLGVTFSFVIRWRNCRFQSKIHAYPGVLFFTFVPLIRRLQQKDNLTRQFQYLFSKKNLSILLFHRKRRYPYSFFHIFDNYFDHRPTKLLLLLFFVSSTALYFYSIT